MPERQRAPTIAQAWEGGRNNFNLMRLVAAWMVIYGHAWAITGSNGADLVARLLRFKYAGGVAVDVFFVISGFLIAASLQRSRVSAYLASRALRILPALLVCNLLVALLLGPLLSTAADYLSRPEPWRYVWINSTLWKSAFWLPGVFTDLPDSAVNGSLWTLPIEAKLYIALLLAGLAGLLAPRRYTPLWALAMLVLYAGVARWHPPEYLVDLSWCTAFFITGTALWVNRARVPLRWPLLLALLAACAVARGTPWFHLPYFFTLAYSTLFVAFVPILPRIRHTDLSYGLYLYGWPAAQVVQTVSPGTPMHNVLWTTPLALSLAALSWFVVERPSLALKRRFGARAPAAAAA
jgi:peptidoglycan/LPS O-acetylase OafA/YrhL